MKNMNCPQCGKEMERVNPTFWVCSCGCTACTTEDKVREAMTPEQIMERAILDNGPIYEVMVAIEEKSELTKALTKEWRDMGDMDNLAEEIADVEICLGMLKMIYYNASAVEDWKKIKLEKLKNQPFEE